MADVVRDHRRFFGTLGVGILLLMAVRGARMVVLPLWAEHLGLSDAATSLIVAISWGVDMLLFFPGGWIMDRYGRRVAAMPTTLGMALGFALLPLTTGFWQLLAVGVLIALGNGFGSGIVMTISADASPDVGRPQFLGAARFLGDIGSAGGPALVSVLAGAASLTVGVASVSVLALSAAAVLLTWLPRGPVPSATSESPVSVP
jgi:MFS family permease